VPIQPHRWNIDAVRGARPEPRGRGGGLVSGQGRARLAAVTGHHVDHRCRTASPARAAMWAATALHALAGTSSELVTGGQSRTPSDYTVPRRNSGDLPARHLWPHPATCRSRIAERLVRGTRARPDRAQRPRYWRGLVAVSVFGSEAGPGRRPGFSGLPSPAGSPCLPPGRKVMDRAVGRVIRCVCYHGRGSRCHMSEDGTDAGNGWRRCPVDSNS